MLIYKLLRLDEWASFDANGTFAGSFADLRDGFIHLSTGEQVDSTFAKHFPDAVHVMLITLDSDRLNASLRWEASRGGALFPHLYRALDRSDIIKAVPFRPGVPA